MKTLLLTICCMFVLTVCAAADEAKPNPPVMTPVAETPNPPVVTPVIEPKDEVIPADITYEKAYKIAVDTKRPLVVVVGAEWCGPCQQLKRTVLPKVLFGRRILVRVDVDKERELAARITTGAVPQIIKYRYDTKTKGWLRSGLMGFRTVKEVQEFVDAEK